MAARNGGSRVRTVTSDRDTGLQLLESTPPYWLSGPEQSSAPVEVFRPHRSDLV